jgi:hypothetical protein
VHFGWVLAIFNFEATEEIMSMYGKTGESETEELNTKSGSAMVKIGARRHNTSFSYLTVKTVK